MADRSRKHDVGLVLRQNAESGGKTGVRWLASAVVALAGFVAVGDILQARPVSVEMKTGRVLDGELISENDDEIVLEISGVKLTLNRDDLVEVKDRKTVEAIYRERRAEVEDDDIEGRYDLAYYLFENAEYDLAEQELESLVAIAPDSPHVNRLYRVILELQEDAKSPDKSSEATSTNNTVTPQPEPMPETDDAQETEEVQGEPMIEAPDPATVVRPQPLTKEEISLVRLWELPLSFDDIRAVRPAIKVAMSRKDFEDFIEAYRTDEKMPKDRALDRIRAGSGLEKLILMMDLQARDFYGKANILNDPPSLREYRTIHSSYIYNYFLPRFGQGQIEGLEMVIKGANAEASIYTNFLVLSNYDDADQQMINRSSPSDSLLLQWGLPREKARYPAPNVRGWRPYFTGENDPRYVRYVRWIGSLYESPKYGVTLKPEEPEETPQP